MLHTYCHHFTIQWKLYALFRESSGSRIGRGLWPPHMPHLTRVIITSGTCQTIKCRVITSHWTKSEEKHARCSAAVPILFALRSTFQERNLSWSTTVALIPKARMCIFGCFYLTAFFKLLVFYRIARAQIIFQILNSLLMTSHWRWKAFNIWAC